MNWLQLLSEKRLGREEHYRPREHSRMERSEFDVDYDRVIFSHPFRRLQDKTQVVPLPEYDFVHTRLTHSLEVSSVGRSLGRAVGMHLLETYPELAEAGYNAYDFGSIVAAASLVHDVGNPPFGHSGEKAISQFFIDHRPDVSENELYDLQNFEGNAQGFRILCDPELKDVKLTYATLGAFMKYPGESAPTLRDKSRKSRKKFGLFQSEKQEFLKIANETGLVSFAQDELLAWCRHPLVFLVEAADDICYLIIDLEDAVRMKTISFDTFVDLLAPILGDKLDRKKLGEMHDLNQQAGLLRAMVINQLVEEAVNVFISHEKEITAGEFDKDLLSCIRSAEAADAIANFSFRYIYRSQQVLEIQAAGFEVLPFLTSSYFEALEDVRINGKKAHPRNQNMAEMLPKTVFRDNGCSETYQVARHVIDMVSGMTDKYAVSLYRKLKGISF